MMHEEGKSIRWIVEKATSKLSSSDLDFLKKELAFFVFFHLGSDADVEIRNSASGLRFSFQHQRIEPFDFELSEETLLLFIQDHQEMEAFLLDQLTLNRRS